MTLGAPCYDVHVYGGTNPARILEGGNSWHGVFHGANNKLYAIVSKESFEVPSS